MKIAGIVAEYNPLHRGHLYHIRKCASRGDIEAIVAVISSNFVQRGEPALVDKNTRAWMALTAGVDLVLELPVVYSAHNAGVFGSAAIDILAATGGVNEVHFGMETPEIGRLELLADILNEEPASFRSALRRHLDEGYSFVQARSMALEGIVPGALDMLKQSNNNLALAYVKRIRERRYDLTPVAIGRVGPAYNDPRALKGTRYASATAIRALMYDEGREDAYSLMPEGSAALLDEAVRTGHVTFDRRLLWRAVKQAVLRSGKSGLAGISEMREGLENRMFNYAFHCASFDEFIDACCSRRYPKGRIRRYCMHLLIGLDHEASRAFQQNGPAYIRVLGANVKGRALLSRMRRSARLPLISRASPPDEGYAREMIRFEHLATELWELLTNSPRSYREAGVIPVMTA